LKEFEKCGLPQKINVENHRKTMWKTTKNACGKPHFFFISFTELCVEKFRFKMVFYFQLKNKRRFINKVYQTTNNRINNTIALNK
jgi:hypothetical protein